jgi:serine/threonine-protein kinase HipA
MTDAHVILWGREIGAVSWLEDRGAAVFQYAPEFVGSSIQPSPLMMPLAVRPFEFPALPRDAFRGLPGLLADSLPDRFGNAVIDAWLAEQNRSADSFNPVERLCYTGARGMGALEYEPAILGPFTRSRLLDVATLVDLSNRILARRGELAGAFSGIDDTEAIEDIIRVGTSAGGARAKAVLAWNPATGEFRSGQIDSGDGFEHWIIKFDGVSGNRDKELADPAGYGLIEYAYHLMAVSAGIDMTDCRLHHEGGRSHFMTRRFDRLAGGGKLHMQSLAALAHFDYNRPDAYSYEQAIRVIRTLGLPMHDRRQQVLRAVFNLVARNQDDHVKNIAFLMNRGGEWRLAPAFDVCYAYQPAGDWTGRHQMSVNGKRDRFERADLHALAAAAGLKKRAADDLIDRVLEAVRNWTNFADEAGVPGDRAERIARTHRLDL